MSTSSIPVPATAEELLPQALRAMSARFDRRTHVILAVLALAACAALFVRVDQVVTATGQIVPSSKVKLIQHLEGGIVKTLHVKEGDLVAEGAPLIDLDLATAGLNLDEIRTRKEGLQFTRARLLAEAAGQPLRFDDAQVRLHPDNAEAERATYAARRREHEGTLAVHESQLAQVRSKAAELEVRLAGAQTRLKTARQELQIATDLHKDQLISQLDYIDRRKSVESLEIDIAGLREATIGAQGAVAESQAKRVEEVGRFRRRSADELSILERQLASATEELQRAADQRGRAVIRSPIAGIVKNLKLQASGNVVRQGEPIMEVVPAGEAILVEAKLSPSDRGYVSDAQKATVKVSAFDFLKYGTLEGTVRQIAADTNREANEAPYYKVVIGTDRTFLGDAASPMRVAPGMQAEIDIHVGSQAFIWYLVKPVLKLRQEAFREP